MPLIKKHFSLAPQNDNPVVISGADAISGGFSHKDGQPTIKFSVPSQPALLETDTLHLVGQFLVKQANDTLFNADQTNLNTSNGAASPLGVGVNLSNFGGVKNVIDKVVIQSKKSLTELSSTINYGQYEALTECYSNNDADYLQSPLSRSLSSGNSAENVNRRVNRAADVGGGGTFAYVDNNDRTIGQYFSIKISNDLLKSVPLHLGNDYLGGLLITLHLAPDSAVFCNRNASFSTAGQANTDCSGVNYVLKNLRLEGRYAVPTPQDLAQYPSSVMLNSRLNLINDINSSVNANSYTPQLQFVKSFVNVFMDANQTNNFNTNQNNFREPPGLSAVLQAKNGLRFPYDFNVPIKPNYATDVEEPAAEVKSTAEAAVKVAFMGDIENRKQFERALLGGREPYHSSATLVAANKAMVEDYAPDIAGGATSGHRNNLRPNCVGVGADFTFGMGGTQNFVNQDYNLTLTSGVNSGNAELPASRSGANTTNPLLQQTFVRHFAQFDLKGLNKVM